MANIPFLLSFDSAPAYYNHNIFPNHMYRRIHPRHHEPLDAHTLGLIARLGAHAHHLGTKHGEPSLLAHDVDGKNGFEIHLDVALFTPEELSVKVINHSVVVECKHEEREDDHGHISRHFVRRYPLPKGYDADKVVSTLSPEGVLTVKAPRPEIDDTKDERIVPITQTGPSDLFLKNHNNNNNKTDETNEKKIEKKN